MRTGAPACAKAGPPRVAAAPAARACTARRRVRGADRDDDNGHSASDERYGIDVQRQRRRAYGIDPPCAQTEHDEAGVRECARDTGSTADACQDERFTSKEMTNRRRIESERLQKPDFLKTLFYSEREEQSCKHQSRDDEKRAEVCEVFAEVRRAARRGKALASCVVH